MKNYISILFLSFPSIALGQIEPDNSIIAPNDSIIIYENQADSINSNGNQPVSIKHIPSGIIPQFSFNLENNPYYTYRMYGPLDLKVPDLTFTPGQSTVFSWYGGELIATGGRVVMPGLMQIESGSIGVYQQVGNFTFYAGGLANKYGYFRGLHTQYGVSGSISYRFSTNVSATAFGTYYFGNPPMMAGNMPMPPSMAGYFGMNKFGGYVDYEANENFGVEVGGQTVKQIVSNKYEIEPIVTPYIKAGSGKKKVKIGLPVGQILNSIIRKR